MQPNAQPTYGLIDQNRIPVATGLFSTDRALVAKYRISPCSPKPGNISNERSMSAGNRGSCLSSRLILTITFKYTERTPKQRALGRATAIDYFYMIHRMQASVSSRAIALALAATVISSSGALAQWVPQTAGTGAAFRGMSVVNSNFVWISGTHGTYAWTADAGTRWHPGTVSGAESFDFRAVHAISLDTAVLMVSGQDTARIYRTTDRGATWKLQYRNDMKGAFLDAIGFFDSRHGLALGDPIDGHFQLLETRDGGRRWDRVPVSTLPAALPNEGAFAASGTALVTCGSQDAWFATGGAAVSRVFHTTDSGRTWTVAETPIQAGGSAAGIFSLTCRNSRQIIAVGGNYAKPDAAAVTVARSEDGGATWTAASPSPVTSFMSGVTYLEPARSSRRVVAVGTEGTVFSTDAGRTWMRLDRQSLNVVMPDGRGSAWAAGVRGSVVRLSGLPRM